VPFPYYAKTANLDVPYLFWFALSVLFFLRALRRGRAADFGFFALAAAAAVATKDQAFALYVLTVPFLVWEIIRRRRTEGPLSVWADRRLALLLVGGASPLPCSAGRSSIPGDGSPTCG
jgi:4-amino-4-deoxy-L-arabinose transferase-like glycosyltransferase